MWDRDEKPIGRQVPARLLGDGVVLRSCSIQEEPNRDTVRETRYLRQRLRDANPPLDSTVRMEVDGNNEETSRVILKPCECVNLIRAVRKLGTPVEVLEPPIPIPANRRILAEGNHVGVILA